MVARIFFGIIDRTVINAMIAFNKLENTSMTALEFRRDVAQSLVTLCQKPKVGCPLRISPPDCNKAS